jgi:hypothetical protein
VSVLTNVDLTPRSDETAGPRETPPYTHAWRAASFAAVSCLSRTRRFPKHAGKVRPRYRSASAALTAAHSVSQALMVPPNLGRGPLCGPAFPTCPLVRACESAVFVQE